MATRVIDDTKLNDIAVAIQTKDSGGQMTIDEMPTRIDALNVTDRWELLNEVTLDADVSIIKIDISAYKNDYSAFLVAPQLTPSHYTEWLYCGSESFGGEYVKGQYMNFELTTGAFEYPKYFSYCSRDLNITIPNFFRGVFRTANNFQNIAYIVLSLYETQSTFLSGGSYKLYGKKTEDYLNVN